MEIKIFKLYFHKHFMKILQRIRVCLGNCQKKLSRQEQKKKHLKAGRSLTNVGAKTALGLLLHSHTTTRTSLRRSLAFLDQPSFPANPSLARVINVQLYFPRNYKTSTFLLLPFNLFQMQLHQCTVTLLH